MQPEKPVSKGEFDQIVERLKSANNILVTINSSPSVDQFAACIGLTLVLNKLNKHANSVFSGNVPSTIDFLQPEKTLEKTTDALRDFIISLDKSKADKLRYKVENDVVRIFITPYRTSISDKDLDFSQGDFNVDAVVALGVHDKNELDEAVLQNARILHDATIISLNTMAGHSMGSINWVDSNASSLCEMVADIAKELAPDIFDKQNSTALLTGIVAETDRYSNEKATPHSMSIAGSLMSAGASTQLVSSKLETKKEEAPASPAKQAPKRDEPDENGMIEIAHDQPHSINQDAEEIVERAEKIEQQNQADYKQSEEKSAPQADEAELPEEEYDPSQIKIDDTGQMEKKSQPQETEEEADQLPQKQADSAPLSTTNPADTPAKPVASRMVKNPPSMGGKLTSNTEQVEDRDTGSGDPLSTLPDSRMINRVSNKDAATDDSEDSTLSTLQEPPDKSGQKTLKHSGQTLSELEKSVETPDEADSPQSTLNSARKDYAKAADNVDTERPKARDDVGSQAFDADNKDTNNSPAPSVPPPMIPPNQT